MCVGRKALIVLMAQKLNFVCATFVQRHIVYFTASIEVRTKFTNGFSVVLATFYKIGTVRKKSPNEMIPMVITYLNAFDFYNLSERSEQFHCLVLVLVVYKGARPIKSLVIYRTIANNLLKKAVWLFFASVFELLSLKS